MTITIWGARGSLPSPEPTNRRYGGNTSCISVENDKAVLVLDAGTGIRPLGQTLFSSEKEIYVLLTHVHSDHIQGFPFFGPLYKPGRTTHVLDFEQYGRRWSLLEMLDHFHFPLRPEEMPGMLQRVEGEPLDFLRRRGFDLTRQAVNHPGGAYGYRLRDAGRSMVFIPDNELRAPDPAEVSFEAVVAFCQGADVLIHDAQYRADDMPLKWGWGHSTLADTCQLAVEAKVGHLVLFHHDPSRTDDALDAVQAEARALLAPHGIACTAAYEGLRLNLHAATPVEAEALHASVATSPHA
jgi:phosphoribosyl 1,2-cyclic phosphodiesterase